MELTSLISTVTGGGLVMILAQFVFTRLVHQVDRLADKITKLEIENAAILTKIEKLNRIESQVEDGNTRIVRLETLIKADSH